jgi:hypothetical protein
MAQSLCALAAISLCSLVAARSQHGQLGICQGRCLVPCLIPAACPLPPTIQSAAHLHMQLTSGCHVVEREKLVPHLHSESETTVDKRASSIACDTCATSTLACAPFVADRL